MGKLIWKPGTLEAPLPPALVACGTDDRPNILTVAWTGICCTRPPMTYISLRPERYSYGIIKESGEFSINLTTAPLVRAADFCGVRSGRDTDKFKLMNLTPVKASQISAPLLSESPLSLECRVQKILELGSHHMFLAEIVALDVDESCVDYHGKLRLDRCGLLAFAHGEYFELGKRLGTFGFSVRKASKADRPSQPGRKRKGQRGGADR